MLAYQLIRENPGRYDGQKQERIEDNYHYHNNVNLIEDAKLYNFYDMAIQFYLKLKK